VPFTPGGVTIHATGKGGTGGIAIIELYEAKPWGQGETC
jgi:hypothetical protein